MTFAESQQSNIPALYHISGSCQIFQFIWSSAYTNSNLHRFLSRLKPTNCESEWLISRSAGIKHITRCAGCAGRGNATSVVHLQMDIVACSSKKSFKASLRNGEHLDKISFCHSVGGSAGCRTLVRSIVMRVYGDIKVRQIELMQVCE